MSYIALLVSLVSKISGSEVEVEVGEALQAHP